MKGLTGLSYKALRSQFQKRDLKVGDEVYYSLEDYESGEDVIYKGKVSKIFDHTLKLRDKELTMTMYQVNEGLACQRNSLYTLGELFTMKDRLEYLLAELEEKNETSASKD